MYVFKSTARYSNGQTVDKVINELQNRFQFLDKFDEYATSRLGEFEFDYLKKFPKGRFNNFLTKVFRDYLISQYHGIQTKAAGYLSFIDTGLLITTTKVSYLDDSNLLSSF